LKPYVFWGNPLNYLGRAITTLLEAMLRVISKRYGKKVDSSSKKIGAH
jgi:N-methylhydantoinase A/oxoprolinase/acetone carboxylase beta subunit